MQTFNLNDANIFYYYYTICCNYIYIFSQIANLQSKGVPLIERRTVMLLDHYYILGEPVPLRDVIKLMKPYNDAYKEIKGSRRWSFFLGLTAGIGLGIGAGELISAEGKEGFSFWEAGIGPGIFLLAVPLSIKADRKADKAIDLYNTRQSMLGKKNYSLKLGLAIEEKGLGLKLKF